jgi:hypothetical protein
MSSDISRILHEWPFEHGQINARVVPGDDGDERLQIRIELGILQMRLDGRPDGQRPQQCESLLEYHEAQVDHDSGEEGQPGRGEDADESGEEPPEHRIGPDECEALRSEAMQYYHRYVALMVLEDFERVMRDTTRNLRVIDLCAKHAEQESDRRALERFRPYIIMMRARALAGLALKDEEPRSAVQSIDDGLESIREHFAGSGQPGLFERSAEARVLREIRDALAPAAPVTQAAELRSRLQRAVDAENYELAAILRDELRGLGDEGGPARGVR